MRSGKSYLNITPREKREYQDYLDLCDRIRSATAPLIRDESEVEKNARIALLKTNPILFCKYYFGKFMDADFGWFHKKAFKSILEDEKIFCILEWAREHAKSVFADLMIPMFLYARGDLSGMVIASSTEDKATGLLGDIQAQFESNELWIADYGLLPATGSWQTKYFATVDGIGFWAFGRGQSPRGIRKLEKRPNYCVVDDIDDKKLCKNEVRVRETVDWVLEDLFGALSIKGARVVVAGNRIHKKSVLAHLVGDIEPGDPLRQSISHIKVFALENPRTHKKDRNGTPAWKERYTKQDIVDKMEKMGSRSASREYFHEHIEEGNVFKHDWIQWAKPLPISKYDEIIVYGDPSFKNTKASDYKAIVAVGRSGRQLHVLKAWVRQATIKNMVTTFYDFFEEYSTYARYYIEANMLQDLLFDDEFLLEGDNREQQLPIRKDKRSKPDKFTRIENLTPLYERGLFSFSEAERKNPDMQTLIGQLLSFPDGHDDGPDALEGATSLLRNAERASNFQPRTGKYKLANSRR